MQTETEEKVKLDWCDLGGDYEATSHVALVRRGGDINIFDILKHLRCDFSNRWSNAPENVKRYRGTGLASYWSHKENGAKCLNVGIDVGCYCAHDCCGHLCSLRYEITLSPAYYVIVKHCGYNY